LGSWTAWLLLGAARLGTLWRRVAHGPGALGPPVMSPPLRMFLGNVLQ